MESEGEDETELARKHLEEDIHGKELEAEERIDYILSRKKEVFCSRCGKRIDSREEWGGNCLHKGCQKLICHECWASGEKRFCMIHSIDYAKKGK
ncbi:MAG: hypothetical protein JSV39_01305 [Candidatus Aenigmatarchaeota archaeon]|nr:MAG: hypothetical protein JSV39_01305 [Candidatus Aenigmarchaeota archaeon]